MHTFAHWLWAIPTSIFPCFSQTFCCRIGCEFIPCIASVIAETFVIIAIAAPDFSMFLCYMFLTFDLCGNNASNENSASKTAISCLQYIGYCNSRLQTGTCSDHLENFMSLVGTLHIAESFPRSSNPSLQLNLHMLPCILPWLHEIVPYFGLTNWSLHLLAERKKYIIISSTHSFKDLLNNIMFLPLQIGRSDVHSPPG